MFKRYKETILDISIGTIFLYIFYGAIVYYFFPGTSFYNPIEWPLSQQLPAGLLWGYTFYRALE